MSKIRKRRIVLIAAILFSLIFLGSCKDNKPEEAIAIGIGRSMNPREPRMALEVLPESNRFFFFISKPLKDTCRYYSGTLNREETEYVKRYLLGALTLLDTLGYKEIDDATRTEVFYGDGNGISKYGFGHIGAIVQEDSIFKIVNFVKESRDFECGAFHKFKTSIQYETLPTPPPLE